MEERVVRIVAGFIGIRDEHAALVRQSNGLIDFVTYGKDDGVALEFPEWGTQRASWRAREVTVGGDADYGARFLDAVNVV